MKRSIAIVWLALSTATAAFSTPSAFAQVQAGLGAFSGVVTDSTNAAVPGATVVLTNPGIGLRKEVVTNASGEYSFPSLTVVGGYVISVSGKGFQSAQIKDIATSVGTVTTENVSLTIGAESTTVEVQGASIEQVQTDTSSVSQLIDSTVFTDSPLSVRNQNTFVGLAAGAAPDTAGTGRGYAVNGARTGTGDFLLDGFDNNDQGLGGGAAGGAVVTISPDAIQEYRIITSVPSAEYGRAGGFVTDTVLRSGTNRIHGTAFEYNRIQALAQNSWFSKQSGLQDHLVRNQFGGSVTGPIYKDKTFFAATAEFQVQSQGSPGSFTGITQAFYNFVKSGAYETWMEGTTQQNPVVRPDGTVGLGFCPTYLGKTCPGAFASVATVGPVFAANYAATPNEFPFGTLDTSDEPTDLLLGGTNYLPVPLYGNGNVIDSFLYHENRGTVKIDHALTTKDQLAFTYSLDLNNGTYNNGAGDSFPGPAELAYGGAQIFGASWIHTFSPTLQNNFKAGYLRHVNNIQPGGPANRPGTFTVDNLGTGFGASGGLPQLFTENQFTYEDSATFVHKTHSFKAGFRFARTRNGSSFYNDVNGTLAFWGAPGLITDGLNEVAGENADPGDFGSSSTQAGPYGQLYYATASLDLTTGLAPNPYRGYRANEFAAYAQDDWKATRKLTLNYGIRWDYFGPPHNFQAGIDSNVYFGTATALTPTGNPFLPNVPLAIGEQGAQFECVAVACGTPSQGKGYAPSNGSSTIWDRDINNLAPRLGFAYDVFGNSKFVVRGGYGIGYDRLYNNVYENIRFNGPHFVDNAYGFGEGNGVITTGIGSQLIKQFFTGNTALAAAGASPVPRHVNQHLKTAYYEGTHFGFETGMKGYVFEANYINTLGRQLVGIMNANTFEGRTACTSVAAKGKTPTLQQARCAAAGYTTLSSARPTSLFGNDNFRTNGFSSNFNAAQVSVRKGYGKGLQLSANYTYGKSLDQISDVFTIKGGGTGIPTPYNQRNNYGPSDFDIRHQATFDANYVSQSANHKLLLGGWGISPIFHMRSGATLNLYDSNSSYEPNQNGTPGLQRAVYTGTGKAVSTYNHSVSPYTGSLSRANFGPYTCPLTVNQGLFCDVSGRNSLTGLRQYNLDASVSKHLNFGERYSLTLQAAFFDIDGHVEFSDPVSDINNSNFGRSLGAGGREGQLSARIGF